MRGRGDVEIAQHQAVGTRGCDRLRCEARGVEHTVQDVAGAVAREHPAGPIGPVRSGREPQDHDASAGIAEARDRSAPVLLVTISAPLKFRDFCRVAT